MSLPIMVWENRIDLIDPTSDITSIGNATGQLDDFVADRREYLQWASGNVAGTDWIRFDLGSPLRVQALGIAGHTIFSSGSSAVRLTADNVGAVGHPLTNVIVPQFNPLSDRAIVKIFDSTYQYWELDFACGAAPTFIGVVFLAPAYLTWEMLPESPFDPDHQVLRGAAQTGSEGNLLGILDEYKLRQFDVSFKFLSPAFIENTFWPFFNTNGRTPLFFVLDPANRPDEASYVRILNDDVTTPFDQNWREVSLQLGGLFDGYV